jgi:hypothetical protein
MRCHAAYLAGAAIADEHELEGGSTRLSISHGGFEK